MLIQKGELGGVSNVENFMWRKGGEATTGGGGFDKKND